MKASSIAAVVMALPAVLAVPHSSRDLIYFYDPSIPKTIFTDATCKLSKYLTPGQPFSPLYPIALGLGAIVTPTLRELVGQDTIEDFDRAADDLCINAQQDPNAGNGVCQDTLQGINDFVKNLDKASQAAQYKCLLNLLCVAHTGVPYEGTCNYLLAGADCIANRIIGVAVPECQ